MPHEGQKVRTAERVGDGPGGIFPGTEMTVVAIDDDNGLVILQFEEPSQVLGENGYEPGVVGRRWSVPIDEFDQLEEVQ